MMARIQGYPSMLRMSDASGRSAAGVWLYTPDLVKTCASWANRDPGIQGVGADRVADAEATAVVLERAQRGG